MKRARTDADEETVRPHETAAQKIVRLRAELAAAERERAHIPAVQVARLEQDYAIRINLQQQQQQQQQQQPGVTVPVRRIADWDDLATEDARDEVLAHLSDLELLVFVRTHYDAVLDVERAFERRCQMMYRHPRDGSRLLELYTQVCDSHIVARADDPARHRKLFLYCSQLMRHVLGLASLFHHELIRADNQNDTLHLFVGPEERQLPPHWTVRLYTSEGQHVRPRDLAWLGTAQPVADVTRHRPYFAHLMMFTQAGELEEGMRLLEVGTGESLHIRSTGGSEPSTLVVQGPVAFSQTPDTDTAIGHLFDAHGRCYAGLLISLESIESERGTGPRGHCLFYRLWYDYIDVDAYTRARHTDLYGTLRPLALDETTQHPILMSTAWDAPRA